MRDPPQPAPADATALDQPVPVQLCCPARLFICLLVALVSSVLCGVSVWVCIFIAHKGYLLLSLPFIIYYASVSLAAAVAPLCRIFVPLFPVIVGAVFTLRHLHS